jgi:hypothetical protein
MRPIRFFSTSRWYVKTRKSGPCFFDAPVGISFSLVYIEAMPSTPAADLEKFQFRHLHPLVRMGTASDRYAGWVGQIYSAERNATTTNRYLESLGFQPEEIRQSVEVLARGPAEVIPLPRKEKAL